jgi:hypothetical protein
MPNTSSDKTKRISLTRMSYPHIGSNTGVINKQQMNGGLLAEVDICRAIEACLVRTRMKFIPEFCALPQSFLPFFSDERATVLI